jgi:hypothetical protein
MFLSVLQQRVGYICITFAQANTDLKVSRKDLLNALKISDIIKCNVAVVAV